MFSPVIVLGSTCPDWSEWILRRVTGCNVRHRGATHWLSTWVLLALFAALVWDVRDLLYWFAMGNVVHWFCDTVTISGAPVGWWSDRRITLFGGRVKTGGLSEAVVTCALVALCASAIYARRDVAGSFIPFFYHWGQMYERGVIDGQEWRAHRFDLI